MSTSALAQDAQGLELSILAFISLVPSIFTSDSEEDIYNIEVFFNVI